MIEILPLQWVAAGGVLLAIGVLLKWSIPRALGVGALVTGATCWALEHEGTIFQILMWIGFSYVSWRSARRGQKEKAEASRAPRRSAFGVVGRIAIVHEPITDGKGKVCIDDDVWEVRGPDAPVGDKVKIVGMQGSVLKIRLRPDLNIEE